MEKRQFIPGNSCFAVVISGVFGVVIKHGLRQTVSSQLELPFRDIPANMVGCFLVGFMSSSSSSLQLVFGSVTSLALWNHAMTWTALDGGWFFALCSLIAGLELAFMSYKIGLDIADFLHGSLEPVNHHVSELSTAVVATFLWLLVASLAVLDESRRNLWLACVVSPLGAWIRHSLEGVTAVKKGPFPVGTFLTNLVSSLAAAALVLVTITGGAPIGHRNVAVDAFQQGLVDSTGSISTVMVQAHCIHGKGKAWHAYLYVLSTVLASAVLVAAIISTTSVPAVPNIQEFARHTTVFA